MSRKTRNLIWSVPLVAALAVVGALTIFAAATPGGVFANTAPGAVTDFSVSPDGPTSIKLSWAAPDGGETPTGYRIDWAPSPGHDWSMLVASQTETEYTDMGLVPTTPAPGDNVTRYYRVFALNSHGPGPESDILQESTKGVQLPGAIDDVMATASGPKTINVTWSEPDENGGLPITGYLVVGGNVAGTTSTADAIGAGKKVDADVNMYAATEYWDASLGTPATVKLTAETTAHFRVFAINAAGTSTVNSNVDSDTTSKANRPDPPMNLVAVQVDEEDPSAGVDLYWHEPADDGGRAITEYVIEHKQGSGRWMELEVTVDAEGDSDGYPTASKDAEDFRHAPTDDGNTANVDESLEKGERVQYRVKSKHSDGTSRVSNTASVTMINTDDATDPDNPRQPTAPSALGVTVAADNLPGKIRITWTHTLTTGDRIDVSKDGMVWEGLVRNTGLTLELGTTTSHRYDHEDLTPGDERYYRVLASDGGIFSIAGLSTTPGVAGAATQPGKTRSLTAVLDSSDPTQINVNWSGLAEDDTGGAKIRRYLIEISEDGTDWPADLTDTPKIDATMRLGYVFQDADKTSYQHKGLPADTRFHYRVRADNSASDTVFDAATNLTPEGTAQTATAKTPAPKKPGMPMALSAHPAADSSLPGIGTRGVYVTWLKPAKVLGGEVTGYNIERKVAGEDTLTDSVDGDRTFYQDTDNLGDQVREYRVAAESDAGAGPWTAWIVYPLQDHMHNTAPERVGMIADMTFTMGDDASTMDVMGYFTDADGDTLTYTAMSSDDMVATAMIDDTDPAAASMLTITPMGAGTATITVTATDAYGTNMSATQTFDVTVGAAGSELMAPRITFIDPVGSGLVTVTWTSVTGAAGYTILAINLADSTDYETEPINNPDTTTAQINDLTPGVEYLIFVAAFDADEFELSDFMKVTAG